MSSPDSAGPSTIGGTQASRGRFRFEAAAGPLFLLVLVLALFHDVLFSDGSQVLSAPHQDLTSQGIPWHEWGFGRLRQGFLPLWNPHTFCGMPFVGMQQSAMLYPPNVLYLVLPVGVATNWLLALHVWLAGLFTYAWARRRDIGTVGATLAGVTTLLCAPYLLHVPAGHLPFLCVAAWTPLVLLVADALVDTPTPGWVLLGVFAVAMQILAGYPQPAYIAAVAGSLHLGLNLVGSLRRGDRGWAQAARSLLAWTAVYVGAALLTAAQLGAAISTTAESARGGAKAPFHFASSFPVPWSNAVTTLVPSFWGDQVNSPYYGEWFVWDTIPYFGAVGLALALYALAARPAQRRFAWTVVLVLLALSLGRQTPLFGVMYDWFPFFGMFRGSGKFAYGAAPFVALLVGLGWETLRARPRRAPLLAVPALLLAGVALYASHRFSETAALGVEGDWGRTLAWVDASADPSLPADQFVEYRQFDARLFLPKNLAGELGQEMRSAADVAARDSAEFVSRRLAFAGIVLGGLGVLLVATRFEKRLAGAVAALLVFEMVDYERELHVTTPTHPVLPDLWLGKAEEVRGDRVLALDPDMFNAGMIHGIDNAWGYDPVMLRRTVQFVAYSQGMKDPARLDELVDQPPFHRMTPDAFAMLRCRYLFLRDPQPVAVPTQTAPMKRLALVGRAVVRKGRDDVLRTVLDERFDVRKTVVLEEEPTPAPEGDRGTVEIVAEDGDSVEIRADTDAPTILLVTDAYSTGWRARELEGDEQHRYEVLPADWMLRAIPLGRGHHHFVMEYSPGQWRAGTWISLVSLPAYILAAGWILHGRRRAKSERHA